MQGEQKTFAIIGVAAAFTVIILLYSTLYALFIAEKINARDVDFVGLKANGNTNQQPAEPAEITIILITDSNNQNLTQLDSLVLQLRQLPEIKIISEKKLERGSPEARQLIEKYKIEKIPAAILDGETEKAAVLAQNWPQLGTIETDGALVLRN